MRSGTLLHRSLLLRQFPIIDIKAASMLQAKPARLSAYYIQDHSSTLAGCSQYFSMFPNSDSLSRSLALPEFQQCPHTGEGAEHPAWGWLRQFCGIGSEWMLCKIYKLLSKLSNSKIPILLWSKKAPDFCPGLHPPCSEPQTCAPNSARRMCFSALQSLPRTFWCSCIIFYHRYYRLYCCHLVYLESSCSFLWRAHIKMAAVIRSAPGSFPSVFLSILSSPRLVQIGAIRNQASNMVPWRSWNRVNSAGDTPFLDLLICLQATSEQPQHHDLSTMCNQDAASPTWQCLPSTLPLLSLGEGYSGHSLTPQKHSGKWPWYL